MDLNDDRYPMRTDGQVSQEWSKMQDTQILTIQCVFPKKFAYWFKNKIDDNEIIVPKIPYLIQWRDQSSGKVTIRTKVTKEILRGSEEHLALLRGWPKFMGILARAGDIPGDKFF